MRIDTFEQARDYLRSFVDFERRGFRRWKQDVVSLDTMRELARRLGDPQDKLACVHIAGTKGKGSTGAMIEAALEAAGYSTGFYTSPHLVDFCERVRLHGAPISHEGLTELVRVVQPAADALSADPDFTGPTFFEVYTAIGFLAFERAGLDVAVIETGLGGRLDATNIITPRLSVITTIGLDHTQILGDTIEAIAGEKAGIIKPGVPVVYARQTPEAMAVFEARAAQVSSPTHCAGAEVSLGDAGPAPVPAKGAAFAPPTQSFTLHAAGGTLWLRTPLLGQHQAHNATVAYEAIVRLREQGLAVSDADFVRGLEQVRWPGRFDVRGARPWMVLDCAHNEPSAAALAAALPEHLEYDRLVLVLGVSGDKDVGAIARRLSPLADHVILAQARLTRAMPVEELAEATRGVWRTEPERIPRVRSAIDRARELAGPRDCICVAGSIFVAGEAAAYLEGLPEEY